MSSRDKLQATRAEPEGRSPVELLVNHLGLDPHDTAGIEYLADVMDRIYAAGVSQGIKRGVALVSGPVRKTVDAALVTAAKNQDGLTKDQPTWATVVQSDS